jgi:hypothetical protein
MQINPATGFFDVHPGEIVTICVTATNTAFSAIFPPAPSCTTWLSTPGPADGKECRKFVAPAAGTCVVVLTFDFQPDPSGAFSPGAKYDISVTGSAGGSFNDFPVVPPPLQNRQYTFNVV